MHLELANQFSNYQSSSISTLSQKENLSTAHKSLCQGKESRKKNMKERPNTATNRSLEKRIKD
mgnify:CR=1 FL=1